MQHFWISERLLTHSLDHYLLLEKLYYLNMSPDVLLWFRNYLCSRVHCVKHSGNYSEWQSMKGGVPQGSALGPLLVLMYVNDKFLVVCYCNMKMILH